MWRLWVFAFLAVASSTELLEELFSWNKFEFNDIELLKGIVKENNFVDKHNLPVGMSVWNDKMFISIPRWKKGVVSTLNYLSLSSEKNNKSPKLTPYPSYKSHSLDSNNPDALISILHARPDVCDRLWVVDMGKDDMLQGGEQTVIKQPRVVVYNLNNNQKIVDFDLSKTVGYNTRSFFSDFVVDVDKAHCEDAYLYIADPVTASITTYSLKKNTAWKFTDPLFNFVPEQDKIKVGDEEHNLKNGIQSLTLTAPSATGERLLYFHSVSSEDVNSVSTVLLKSEVRNQNSIHKFTKVGTKGNFTQSLTAFMDTGRKIIYYPLFNKNTIACWKTETLLKPDALKLVAKNDLTLAFVPDMFIDEPNNKFYALSSNFKKLYYKPELENDKFIVYTAPLSKLADKCNEGIAIP